MAQSSSPANILNTHKLSLVKLSKQNYRIWSARLELLFQHYKLWNVVSGSSLKPDTPGPDQVIWEEKDLVAKMELLAHISDVQGEAVRKLQTSHQIWEKLKTQYEPQTDAAQVHTLRAYVTFTMKEEDDVDNFLTTWEKKLDDTITSGLDISDKLQRCLLLGALPSSWSSFVTTQNLNKKATVEDLMGDIRQEDSMRKIREENTSTQAIAMAAYRPHFKSQPRYKSFKSQWINAPMTKGGMKFTRSYCNICKRPGHTPQECKAKQKIRRFPSNIRRPQAHIVEEFEEERNEDEEEEEEEEEEVYAASMEEKNEYEEEGYSDLMQAFVAEALVADIPTKKDDKWYLDTGATNHLTHRSDWLQRYTPLQNPITVRFGNNGVKQALGKGQLTFHLPGGGNFTINDVYHVPGITKNLLSISQATSNGTIIEFHHNQAVIRHLLPNGLTIRTSCKRQGGLYPISVHPTTQSTIEVHTTEIQRQQELTLLWHYRLGHPHLAAMRTLQTHKLAQGVPKDMFCKIDLCEACLFGKMASSKFPTSNSRRSRPLELVHSDICGPFPTQSLLKSKYFISFIDDYTRFTILTFLKSKDQAFIAFTNYKSLTEKQLNLQLKCLQSDGGGEYTSNKFTKFCKDHGILQRISVPSTPQQNGLAERKNRTLLNSARSMLNLASLSPSFWEEAVATA